MGYGLAVHIVGGDLHLLPMGCLVASEEVSCVEFMLYVA